MTLFKKSISVISALSLFLISFYPAVLFAATEPINLSQHGFYMEPLVGFETVEYTDNKIILFDDTESETRAEIGFFEVPANWSSLQAAQYLSTKDYFALSIIGLFAIIFSDDDQTINDFKNAATSLQFSYQDYSVAGRSFTKINVNSNSELFSQQAEYLVSVQNGSAIYYMIYEEDDVARIISATRWQPLNQVQSNSEQINIDSGFSLKVESPWVVTTDDLLDITTGGGHFILHKTNPKAFVMIAPGYEAISDDEQLQEGLEGLIDLNSYNVAKKVPGTSVDALYNDYNLLSRLNVSGYSVNTNDNGVSLYLLTFDQSAQEQQKLISDFEKILVTLKKDSSIVIPNQSNSTDLKIIEDIKRIQTSLELYYNDHQKYPSSPGEMIRLGEGYYDCLSDKGFEQGGCSSSDVYMRNVPSSPYSWFYNYFGNDNQYFIQLWINSDVANLKAGEQCATQDGIFSFSCTTITISPNQVANETPQPQQPVVKPTPSKAVEFINREKSLFTRANQILINKVQGRILLQVEGNGEAWYLDPVSKQKFYLENGNMAYLALRKFGLGITNQDLRKIPIGFDERLYAGLLDSDGDGLPNKIEEGVGTDSFKADTDGDGFSDKTEVISNHNPLGQGSWASDMKMLNSLRGRIVLQVESRGEAWYINPTDGKRYFLGDGNMSYQIMRFLSLGIKNTQLREIPVGDL